MKELKLYKTEKPVNSAAISPINDHVLLGGGQEAVDAAVYSKSGKFEARFFHLVFEEEFARVRDHFGPINSVAFHPDGKRFVKKSYFLKSFIQIYKIKILNSCIIRNFLVTVPEERTVSFESITLISLTLILKLNTSRMIRMFIIRRKKKALLKNLFFKLKIKVLFYL